MNNKEKFYLVKVANPDGKPGAFSGIWEWIKNNPGLSIGGLGGLAAGLYGMGSKSTSGSGLGALGAIGLPLVGYGIDNYTRTGSFLPSWLGGPAEGAAPPVEGAAPPVEGETPPPYPTKPPVTMPVSEIPTETPSSEVKKPLHVTHPNNPPAKPPLTDGGAYPPKPAINDNVKIVPPTE
jgi:hypothetical protein